MPGVDGATEVKAANIPVKNTWDTYSGGNRIHSNCAPLIANTIMYLPVYREHYAYTGVRHYVSQESIPLIYPLICNVSPTSYYLSSESNTYCTLGISSHGSSEWAKRSCILDISPTTANDPVNNYFIAYCRVNIVIP